MGMETAEWYNNFCLIGHTDERGMAWHYQKAMQGKEPNHYPGPIPYSDVVRRLFGWKPKLVPSANLIPCKATTPGAVMLPYLDEQGNTVPDDDGKPILRPYKVLQETEKVGVVRSDNNLPLGKVGRRYRIHDYEEWLLKLQSNVIGDSLDIWSAILLRNGAQACVQVALPETAHDDTTGMDYVPYIHAYTSLDGSLSTTFAAQTLLIVCDNTMLSANRNAEGSGRFYRARHSEASLSTDRIEEVRTALSLIHESAEETQAFFKELSSIKVPDKKWVEVMDIIIPPANSKDDSKATQTRRDTKREKLNATYKEDPMANTWKGTALGVVQAVNTYATHYLPVRGRSRTQANATKVVNGEFAKLDRKVLGALATVLNKPELAMSDK